MNSKEKPFLVPISRRDFLRTSAVLAPAPPAAGALAADVTPGNPLCKWLEEKSEPDTYAAFRGTLTLDSPREVELRFLGASWFVLWLDGQYFAEGPARFTHEFPEYHTRRVTLGAGKHVLAAHVHHDGVKTRHLLPMAPFWMCQAFVENAEIPVAWKAVRLEGYEPRVRRINPELSWIEWADTRKQPKDWQAIEFNDAAWQAPVSTNPGVGAFGPLQTGEVQSITHHLTALSQGTLVERYGGELDDPPARFYLRCLEDCGLPPQGVWRRYDLGRVRLGKPRLSLDLPPGAVVEFATSEALERGRVNPWLTFSDGPSCNMDHYVARGGPQEFFSHSPKGGRFFEVHVIAPTEQVHFLREEYLERTYHPSPEGSFASGDALLDRIWMTGIETYRACSEDSVIDNPTRERGQWLGDVASVGIEIAGVGYSDLRSFRRSLKQFAQCAREDGLVAGLCPGGRAFLSTFSAQWVTACLRYSQLTGDKELLTELFPAAGRNVEALERCLTTNRATDRAAPGFVDWGYVPNSGDADIAVNLHFLAAVRDMLKWSKAVGAKGDRYAELDRNHTATISTWFDGCFAGAEPWDTIGMQRAVLGLRLGFFNQTRGAEAVTAIKRHIDSCFPLDPSGPRLSHPGEAGTQFFTPYFSHFTMPELIHRGEMDFVLEAYRKAWGWALEDGRTTWVEVFDTRWSHCHQWSGCPTWQLSRFVLGLDARFDRGPLTYSLNLWPGNLPAAEGSFPLPGGRGVIKVRWTRTPKGIEYDLKTPAPITLEINPRQAPNKQGPLRVERTLSLIIPTDTV